MQWKLQVNKLNTQSRSAEHIPVALITCSMFYVFVDFFNS